MTTSIVFFSMSKLLTRRKFVTTATIAVVGLSGCIGDDDDEEYNFEDQPEDVTLSFVSPEDGATVQSPVEFVISVEGADLVPAGENVVGAGHLHLLVDHDFYDRGEVIPGPSAESEEDGIYHWSDARTESTLELEPGEYTIGVQIADGAHRAFGGTDQITITVE